MFKRVNRSTRYTRAQKMVIAEELFKQRAFIYIQKKFSGNTASAEDDEQFNIQKANLEFLKAKLEDGISMDQYYAYLEAYGFTIGDDQILSMDLLEHYIPDLEDYFPDIFIEEELGIEGEGETKQDAIETPFEK